MRVTGLQVRNAAVLTFDVGIVAAFPACDIEADWFWTGLAGLLIACVVAVGVLELCRLIAPDWTDGWWDPDGPG